MDYDVAFRRADARATAVVRASTTWSAWPTLWSVLLDEVWACLRANGINRGCPNVMVYRSRPAGDAVDVDVEVGVQLRQPCPLTGRVVASALPAGEVATTVHRGPYAGLGAAYEAVAQACDREGRHRTTTKWEVYGPHHDDPAELTTEIFWLLNS